MQDLPHLKATYREVIDEMNHDMIQIWDDDFDKRECSMGIHLRDDTVKGI